MKNRYNFDTKLERRYTHSYKWNVPRGVLSLSIADTDFLVAKEIQKAIIDRANRPTYGYTFVPQTYYDAYINWWSRRYGLELQREWFMFSSSIVASIDSIIKRVSKEGDKISLFSPNYNVFYNCIQNNKREILEVPLKYENYEYSIEWVRLENAIKQSKIFILCNPHNPIGFQHTKEQLEKIIDLCEKYDTYLLTDEIHADLDYNETRYIPALKVRHYSKLIMLVSPGKSFNLAGLHSSVVIIEDPELRELVQKGLYEDDVGEPSYFSIEPVIAAYNKCEQYVVEENEYLKENKRILTEFLHKNDINIKVIGGKATYLLWLDVSAYSDDSEAFANGLLKHTGVLVIDGKHYHEHYSTFIRVNIATQRDNIYRFLNAIKTYVKKEDR